MTSPFSPEQLVFLQRFVSSVVRSMVGEDSRTEREVEPKANVNPMATPKAKSKVEIEPKVEVKAASRPKARPKRKLRAPTDQSIGSSPSPRTKKPKANPVVASTEPSKPNIPIVSRNPYCVCLRCSRMRHLDCQAVIPRTMQTVAQVQPASPLPRFGCFRCGDPEHFIRDCPHPRSIPKLRKPYVAPCRQTLPLNPHLICSAQRERGVGLVRDSHQNPDRDQVSANPPLKFKDDQAQATQESVSK